MDFEDAVTLRALDRFIEEQEGPGFEEWVKDDRGKKHRRKYITLVVYVWAHDRRISVQECEISSVEGSPMLTFMQAATDAVLARSGQSIDSERMKQIVSAIKKRYSPTPPITNGSH